MVEAVWWRLCGVEAVWGALCQMGLLCVSRSGGQLIGQLWRVCAERAVVGSRMDE